MQLTSEGGRLQIQDGPGEPCLLERTALLGNNSRQLDRARDEARSEQEDGLRLEQCILRLQLWVCVLRSGLAPPRRYQSGAGVRSAVQEVRSAWGVSGYG